MTQPANPAPRGGRAIGVFGCLCALASIPAVAIPVYRRRVARERPADSLSMSEGLLLAGAVGSVVYGLLARNRASAMAGSCLGLGLGAGLAAARLDANPRGDQRRTALDSGSFRRAIGRFHNSRSITVARGARGFAIMASDDDDNRESGSRSGKGDRNRADRATSGAQVIGTDDPAIHSGPASRNEWEKEPNKTMVVETTRIREPDESRGPDVLMVPVKYEGGSRPAPRGNDGDGESKASRRGDRYDDRNRRDRDEDREDASEAPSLMMTLLFTGLVALVCGMVGAAAYSYFFGSSRSDDSQSSGQNAQSKNSTSSKSSSSQKSSGSGSGSMADSGKEIPGFTASDDADTLRKQNEHLAERIDQLSQRVDQMSQPRNQTSPDVRTLQIKVGDLARSVQDMGDLPGRLRRMENRLEEIGQQVKSTKTEMDQDRSVPGTVPVVPMPLPTGEPLSRVAPGRTFQVADAPDSALNEGIALFHKARYREARDIFLKLQLTEPGDARVWYYSALARGLVTGDWGAETKGWVEKGVEHERAGKPGHASIDQSLAGLTREQGKEWLDAYRGRVAVAR